MNKPILYSTPMVQAIQEDRKTKTRRTKGLDKINVNPKDWILDGVQLMGSFIFHNVITHDEFWIKCPYGEIGDILWVRETFLLSNDEEDKCFVYKANLKEEGVLFCRWKPSIHMPKIAARLFLQIVSIKLERLQDITESDAIAEGVESFFSEMNEENRYKNYLKQSTNDNWKYLGQFHFNEASYSFFSLWELLNGKESIDLNPWVWVIEFEKVEKPENFI